MKKKLNQNSMPILPLKDTVNMINFNFFYWHSWSMKGGENDSAVGALLVGPIILWSVSSLFW